MMYPRSVAKETEVGLEHGCPHLGHAFSMHLSLSPKQDFKKLCVSMCVGNPQENLLFKAQESLHGHVKFVQMFFFSGEVDGMTKM